MKRTTIALAALMIAGPAMADDRFDVIKNVAAYGAILTIARDNCPGMNHNNILKNFIGALRIIKQTDAEVAESIAIEARMQVDVEAKMRKIGTIAWCGGVRDLLKEYEK